MGAVSMVVLDILNVIIMALLNFDGWVRHQYDRSVQQNGVENFKFELLTRLIMDSQNEYLVIMKKHNRKIVERAYQNSVANSKYTFPKNKLAPETYSEISESISLCSRVSETYDLNQQNAIPNVFHNLQKKIAPLTSISKIKQKTNEKNYDNERLKTLLSSRNIDDAQKMSKRQFLSLTPKKQFVSRYKNSVSLERTTGINLTRRKQLNFTSQTSANKNPQRQSESFMKTLQKMTSKCFGASQDQHIPKEQTEVIFNSEKMVFNEQQLTKPRIKMNISDKLTADSSPFVQKTRTKTNNNSKHRRGMSIVKLRQKVTVSPFMVS